jgi:hypothetical protein
LEAQDDDAEMDGAQIKITNASFPPSTSYGFEFMLLMFLVVHVLVQNFNLNGYVRFVACNTSPLPYTRFPLAGLKSHDQRLW